MAHEFNSLINALNGLANAVEALPLPEHLLVTSHGWNLPPLNKRDFAFLPRSLAAELIAAPFTPELTQLAAAQAQMIERIQAFQVTTLPQFPNQPVAVYPALFALVDFLRAQVLPALRPPQQPEQDWEKLADTDLLPKKLVGRLKRMSTDLDNLVPDFNAFSGKVQEIEQSFKVAEALPASVDALERASQKLALLNAEAAKNAAAIDLSKDSAQKASEAIKPDIDRIKSLISLCEDAYQIVTTKGLASAFEDRARQLTWTMRAWIIGLALSLTVAAWLSSSRLGPVLTALNNSGVTWQVASIQIFFALLGLGGPLWFAWLSAKQIGQNFRLAEDYAFKATIAKGYAGYSKEAATLDPSFKSRIFETTLSRLDEQPLRLIEQENHASPLHELFSSSSFKKAVDLVPELKDKLINMADEGLSSAKKLVESISVEKPKD